MVYMPSYASIHPKPLYYHTNGTGRDTYIDNNNGGLTVNREQALFPTIGSFGDVGKGSRIFEKRPNLGNKHSFNLLPFKNKHVSYRPNGSGRDTYIQNNILGGSIVASNSSLAIITLFVLSSLYCDGAVYFSRQNSNLSPSKVSPPQEFNRDRTLNFFVGQLRSYQRPNNSDPFNLRLKNKQRQQIIKQIVQRQTLHVQSRSQSMDNLEQTPLEEDRMRTTFTNSHTYTPLQPLKIQDKRQMVRIGRNNSEASTLENTPLNLEKELYKGKGSQSQSLLESLGAKGTYDLLVSQNASHHRQMLTHKLVSQKQRQQILRLSQPKLRVTPQALGQANLQISSLRAFIIMSCQK